MPILEAHRGSGIGKGMASSAARSELLGMSLFGASLGTLVGLTLGLLGGGGSVLTVPLLVYALGLAPKVAIASSLAVVGMVSLVGAHQHARAGNVEVRTAVVFGLVAMVGAWLGARASVWLPGTVQLALFAVVMLVAAVFMLRGRPDVQGTTPRNRTVVATAALAVGALTGVVGVGGGFVIVPTLVLLLGVPMKRAVGTSLLVIAMNSTAGFVGYLSQVTIPWGLLAGFALFALAGIVIGSRLAQHLAAETLRKAFAVFLIMVAVFMLVQNLAFTAGSAP